MEIEIQEQQEVELIQHNASGFVKPRTGRVREKEGELGGPPTL